MTILLPAGKPVSGSVTVCCMITMSGATENSIADFNTKISNWSFLYGPVVNKRYLHLPFASHFMLFKNTGFAPVTASSRPA